MDLHTIDSVKFTPVRLREGYDMGEVDALLDRARHDMVTGQVTLTAADVRSARFTPVRLRVGYDMGEVDAFLDRLERHITSLAHPSAETDSVTGGVTGGGSFDLYGVPSAELAAELARRAG